MGSRGRSSPQYRLARAEYATGRYPCHLCGLRPGTWVDHQPPLSDFATPEQWQGRLLPSCPKCQQAQGASIRNGKTKPPWTF